jgi:pSer/pThr/pTyr-binding forkhead associated (FHA) protein
VKCKTCGAALDFSMGACPSCGADVELGRLTGILGIVCRACDSYNDPGARTCAGCGKPLGAEGEASPAEADGASANPPPASTAPSPRPSPPLQVRSFPKGGAATRFVPAAILRPPAPDAPAHTPIPLVTKCPRCGVDAGLGAFCQHCGQAFGPRGTQVMKPAVPDGRNATQVFGALRPGRAKLVLERGEGVEGATFPLDAETVEAGRSKGAVVFPSDPCLAPHHASFFCRAGALHVRDEGAPGGTYLRLRGLSVPLRPGDHFVVGDRLLRYAGPLPPAPPQPPDGTRRLGAPRPPGNAVVIEEWLEGGGPGRVFVRGGPSVTIGRVGCAVNLGDDGFLYQAHAELLLEGDGARLRDLGSSNGTFVRIPPHCERELRDGDAVRIGREVLRVALGE